MDYTGFQIVWKILLLFGIIYAIYFIATRLDKEWSILILSLYFHCFFMYISFFPIVIT